MSSQSTETRASLELLGCSITQACEMYGMGRGDFYRDFIRSGLVKPIKRGKRARTIVVAELREAFAKYVAEKRQAEQPPEAA